MGRFAAIVGLMTIVVAWQAAIVAGWAYWWLG
jgi:hypothetical protein